MGSFDGITWRGTFTPHTEVSNSDNTIRLNPTWAELYNQNGQSITSANYSIDTIAPTLSNATVSSSGREIILNFNEQLADRPIDSSDFIVKVNKQIIPLANAVITGAYITLSFSKLITSGDTVEISFNLSADNSNLATDLAGNQLQIFNDIQATNNSAISTDINNDGIVDGSEKTSYQIYTRNTPITISNQT